MTNSTTTTTSKPETTSSKSGNGIAASVETSKASGGKAVAATTAQTGKPDAKPAAVPSKPAAKKGPKTGEQVNLLGQQQKALAERIEQTDNRLADLQDNMAELLRRLSAPAAAPQVPSNAELLRRQREEEAAIQEENDRHNAEDAAFEEAAENAEATGEPGEPDAEIAARWAAMPSGMLETLIAAGYPEAMAEKCRRTGAAEMGVAVAGKIVSYAAAKPVKGGSVENTLARQSVRKQLTDAERIASFRLKPGEPMHRDYNRHKVKIQKRTDDGKPVFDAKGEPVMEEANAACDPAVRRYIETQCQVEYPHLDLMVFDGKGKPTGGRVPMRFVTSQRSGNPMFKISGDATFFVKDSNGNCFEFAPPSSRGLYFVLRGYNGAKITDAFGNDVTREDAA